MLRQLLALGLALRTAAAAAAADMSADAVPSGAPATAAGAAALAPDGSVSASSSPSAAPELSPELDLDAPPAPPGTLLLAGRKFPLDLAGGGLQIHGTPLFVLERHNSGLGTGLTLWDGAVVLAKLLETRFAAGMAGVRVVEVGAGTGAAGIAAAMLGADALLTDLPYALDNLRDCARRNAGALKGSAAVAALDWADPRGSAAALPPELRGRLDAANVDLIIGADVVWVPELIAPLGNTLRVLARRALGAAADDGAGAGARAGAGADADTGTGTGSAAGRGSGPTVLISHQTRSRHGDELLFAGLRAAGFAFRLLDHSEHHPRFNDRDINVIEAWLEDPGERQGAA